MSAAALSSTAVREAVAELLGVSAAEVDPEADLIAQGLDSIRMMSLAGKWRKLGAEVDFAALAASPSVRAWSDLIGSIDPDDAGGCTPAPCDGPDPDAGEPFPLAPMQHAMWVGREDGQHLGGVAGHLYVEFDGSAIDSDRLTRAATALAARHPMLRVQFLPDGTQRIGPAPAAFPVTVTDYRASTGADVEALLAAVRGEKSHQQLDDAVFELTVSRLAGNRTRLHVDLDMQAADAMSYRTLMTDLAQLYRGAALEPLGYTYRQYRLALATGAVTADPAREADRQWWQERIPDLPDPPRLPLVAPDVRVDSRHTTRRWHWLDPDARDALFEAARRRGITPAMAVAASFSDALAGWSTERRFLMNLPMFGRDQHHPDVDRLVGDFTSSLLLDVDLTDGHTATARSRALQAALHSAAAHSSHPGLAVLRDLARHRGAPVLAPIVYTSALGLGELFAPVVTETFGTPVWINSQGPQVLLDAQVTEFDGGVLINWDVRENAFAAGVIDAMFDRHVDELRRLAAHDDAWDGPPMPVLTDAQRQVRTTVTADTAAPSGDNLVDGFHRAVERTPDAVAVIASTGTLTYAALRHRVLAVAAALQSRGVGPGDVVAVMGPKNADQIPALLGILTAGAAYLPVGIDQPAVRATRILDTGGVQFVLATGREMPDVELPSLTVRDAEIIGDPAHFEAIAVAANDLAYVLFTSGSTGEPKGVELTHGAVMNTLEFLYRHFEIGPNDRALALSHLESDMSVPDVFGTLRVGGAIVVVDEEHRRDPDAWVRLIDQHGVTVVNFLPGWLDMLVEVGGSGRSLETLRVVLVGGDWVRPNLVRSLRRLSPCARFAGLGGATETAIHGTLYEVGADLAVDAPAHWPSIPYGKPFPHNSCRVVGTDGRDTPDWVTGELWFGGRGLARGYRGRPELTAEKFVEHDGRIWYRSGDLARYWPDGTLEFVGRSDHRVKISGYRIELGDVEAALRRVGGVGDAVAAVVPREGEGDVLGALIRLDDDGVDVDTVPTVLSQLVPEHMIPTVLVVAERFPVRNGKIDRKVVAATLAEAQPARSSDYRAPITPLESALVDILGEVLGRDVGVDDDFFALGGDSVMATTAVARVRDWLDTPTVMVPDVFAARTVAQLAHRLSSREPGSDRLERVAELYLEVSGMDGVEVASELERVSTPST